MVSKTDSHSIEKINLSADKRITFFGVPYLATDIVLLGVISLTLLLQLHLQFIQKLNWDEFFYLSHIYDAKEGRLDKTLQMGHVYLFRWLTLIPGGEITQITVGRIFMWVVQLGTLGLIVKIARRFMPLTYALFAALCFLGLGFVFVHGTSFRADPFAAFCMMISIYVLAVSRLQRKDLSLLATSLTLGAFLTVKVILFAPLLAVLAFIRLAQSEDRKVLFFRFIMTLMASLSIFLVALFLHSLTLTTVDAVETTHSLRSTAETIFISGGLFPKANYMKLGFLIGVVPSLMVGLGVLIVISSMLKNKTKSSSDIFMLAFVLPLFSLVFYRNSFPYFYAFNFPVTFILAGYAAYKFRHLKFMIGILSSFIFLSTVLLYMYRFDETRAVQAQTLSAVHQIFPEPVLYFDRNSMIASFPKAGFFMSSWGLRNYNISGERKFISEMKTHTIPLLVENSPAISAALKGEVTPLFEEDARALRENYIPHWGHIWVAGKKLSISSTPSNFSILVPGEYTLSASNLISVDGKLYKNGDVITFNRGAYIIESDTTQDVILRWGNNLLRPYDSPITKPIFRRF